MFRFDRFLTLYFFFPWIKRRRLAAEFRIPVLMYHSISDAAEDGIHPYYRVNTSPGRFAQHMKYLYDNNYRVISLSEAANLLCEPQNRSGDNRPDKSGKETPATHRQPIHVVLTFDDGFLDFQRSAFPIVTKHRFKTTVFLPTAFIDNAPKNFKQKECLTWDEIRKLTVAGIEFGSHTVNHPQLFKMAIPEIEFELGESKRKIEFETKVAVESFSYPYAFPDQDQHFKDKIKKVLEKCGYKNAVTTKIGSIRPNDERFFLKRMPINSGDDPALLRAKLAGAYDWLYYPQRFVKRQRNIFRRAIV